MNAVTESSAPTETLTFYLSVETKAEAIMRQSNACADAVAARMEFDGECDDTLAEVADTLATFSRLAAVLDSLGRFAEAPSQSITILGNRGPVAPLMRETEGR